MKYFAIVVCVSASTYVCGRMRMCVRVCMCAYVCVRERECMCESCTV